MSNDVKILYQRIKRNFERNSYINLNYIQVRNKEDLAELGYIFRNPLYETFRIIYMKNDTIVGHEAISSKLPSTTKVFLSDKNGRTNVEKNIYKIYNRMNRLSADGYYMVHNHTSGRAVASKSDMSTTAFFYTAIPGFKGHLIINCNSYAWIDVKDDRLYAYNNNEIKNINNKYQKKIETKGIYDIKIKNRKDLVNLMYNIKNNKDYSTAIITDSINIPRMIIDIPNKFLNMNNKQLQGYFENINKSSGGSKTFIATDNTETYKRCTELAKENILIDTILYERSNGKLNIKEGYIPKENRKIATKGIFENKKEFIKPIRINETKNEYDMNYKTERFLTVLYKKVDEPPKVIKIPNTLEEKQKLVRGLIEVVPYKDCLIICNEEGKLLNLKQNLIFDYDYIAGDCFLVGDDYIHGDFKSLTSEQIERFTRDFIHRSCNKLQEREE